MSDATNDVSLEELQQRLVTFTEQLESIHELLQSDPENAEFLNIAQDLVEVIRLTKEMIDLKLNANEKNDVAGQHARKRAAVEHDTREARDLEAKTAEPPALAFSPGTTCEAQSNGTWYPAFIESITARNTYNVHYLGFGNKDELSETSLRAIEHSPEQLPPRSDVVIGYLCVAKYYVDSQWYTATVTAITAYGVQVLFDGYGNTEEVPFEYLRVRSSADVATTAAAPSTTTATLESNKPAKAAVTGLKPLEAVLAKPIKVPENLQILPDRLGGREGAQAQASQAHPEAEQAERSRERAHDQAARLEVVPAQGHEEGRARQRRPVQARQHVCVARHGAGSRRRRR
ncbi:hypothetical protein PINS_up005291 [Pythium insidiosum]|nr:hypothetical protein PINS_up005291 [Pythium insidiosum]